MVLENIFSIYKSMEESGIVLSFKGDITSDLLTSVLQIMEQRLDSFQEEPKIKKKVYHVLVECLQNLYHHMDEIPSDVNGKSRSAIFMIGKTDEGYSIITGNYILNENVTGLKKRIDDINALTKDELKEYYKQVLTNGEMSMKGGGGLGIIDIARKSGEKLTYEFLPINNNLSFFILKIKINNKSI
ncbi:MAG: SiaB family protein kinase [Bacteroidia bacterium]